MANNDALKRSLKKAAKRRAIRKESPASRSNDDGQAASSGLVNAVTGANVQPVRYDAGEPSAVPSPNGSTVRSGAQSRALDLFVSTILQAAAVEPKLCDRDLVGALKAMQRGYPPSDDVGAALYQQLMTARRDNPLETHPTRRALIELIDLVAAYDQGNRSSRAALDYLHSIAN